MRYFAKPMAAMLGLAAAVAVLAAPASAPRADAVEDFYKGRTLTIYVGVSPGGIYSTFALLLSNHMGKYIPGKPDIVVQHMRGAGGTKALNYVYNVAPRDGSVVITPNAGVTKRVVLGIGNPKYDPAKMHWLGGWGEAVNTLTLRKDIAPVTTLDEAKNKEVILGAIGKSSNTFMMPMLMNSVLGTKLKMITGYRGGSPIRAAIEKGEVQGWMGQWMGWKLRKPDWVAGGKLVHLVQAASKKAADLPDVPLLSSFARNDEEKTMFEFVGTAIADRAFATAPDVPADRRKALADAYWKTLHDETFLAEANKRSYPIDPVRGPDIQAFVNKVVNTPPEMVNKLKVAMGIKTN